MSERVLHDLDFGLDHRMREVRKVEQEPPCNHGVFPHHQTPPRDPAAMLTRSD